jgi:hypothetical protein
MGKGSKWIESSNGNSFVSCETHPKNLSSRQKENRGGTAGEVGEGEGGEEESGIEPRTRGENDSSDLQTEEKVYAACNRGSKTRP